MNTYAYRDQDTAAGQAQYDAWAVTPETAHLPADGMVTASSRSDVLHWRTGFRPPQYHIYDAGGQVLAEGTDGPKPPRLAAEELDEMERYQRAWNVLALAVDLYVAARTPAAEEQARQQYEAAWAEGTDGPK